MSDYRFVIVDRIGGALELVPLQPPTTGVRGALLLWFRTGSDMVIPNVFRLLSIATPA